MARTAIVNPRRKAKKRKTRKYGKRRRNPITSTSSDRNYNPRRRRVSRKRRRNPSSPATSVYSAGGYRRKNPDLFDFDNITEKMPAATLGVLVARYAFKMAGPMEPDTAGGPALPGVKHAIALVLGTHFGSQIIGNLLGSNKTLFAECGGLGFAGDLFLRKRALVDNAWAQENLYLSGDGDDYAPEGYEEGISGFENQSALGAGEYVVGPDGTLYQMSGTPIASDAAYYPGGNSLVGFENQSALASADSSFGYARR